MSLGSIRLVPNMCPSLTEEVYEKLRQEGIENTIQFLTQNFSELSLKTKICVKTLENISKVLYSFHGSFPISGMKLFEDTLEASSSFTTGYPSLDEILDGGFQTGEIAEIFGVSGVGKTTLCFNVALHASIKCKKKVLYVDPLASVTPSRVTNSIQKFVDSDEVSDFSLESFEVVNPTTVWELFQILHRLTFSADDANFSNKQETKGATQEEFMKCHELVIIDSFAHFIYPLLGGPKDNAYGILNLLEKNLKSLAKEKKMVVVLVNNSVKLNDHNHRSFPNSNFTPALGKMWSHVPHHRISLQSSNHLSPQVSIQIIKSTRLKNSSCVLNL